MGIIKKMFGCKPQVEKRESIDLSKLENHYILNVGLSRCDVCEKETNNCCKIDLAGQCLCICPRKDLKGFNRPKK